MNKTRCEYQLDITDFTHKNDIEKERSINSMKQKTSVHKICQTQV